jgi:hypothetical protein
MSVLLSVTAILIWIIAVISGALLAAYSGGQAIEEWKNRGLFRSRWNYVADAVFCVAVSIGTSAIAIGGFFYIFTGGIP